MKRDNINYLLVGGFVLSMLVILIVSLFKITGRGVATDPYYVLYSNITGIREGSTVTYGGYQIGQVEEIMPMRDGGVTRYKMQLGIKAGWRIPSDSVARIVTPGLLSDNQIDIEEGKSRSFLSPGDTIEGEAAISIKALLDSVVFEINDLSENNIKPLISNINQHVDSIGGELDTSIPQITQNINRLLAGFQQSADRLAKLLGNQNQAHIANLLQNFETMTTNLVNLSSGFDKVTGQLNNLLQNSNSILAGNNENIRHTVVELRNSMDTISQSINGIVYNLEMTSRNMNEFSRRIREHPGILLRGQPPEDKGVAQP
jgi:phospholipid/cholesterol/gamma-HCH transport system substrate-binding protein